MTAHPNTGKFLLGGILMLALLVGGGTTRGLYTDQVVVSLSILVGAWCLSRVSAQPMPGLPVALAAAIVALCLLQLVPLPAGALSLVRPQLFYDSSGAAMGFTTISLGIGRTVESLLLVVAPVAFFLCVLRLAPDHAKGLVPFFLVGVAANVALGVVQFSSAVTGNASGLLPYRIAAGVFANVNHFSTLLFVAIPILVYFVFRGRPILSLSALVCILLMLLAASSRAGALIGFAITVLSFIVLPARTRPTVGAVIGLFAGLAIYTAGTWSKIDSQNVDSGFGRLEFARTTIEGIWQNWPVGIGFGNFVKGYAIYENPQMVFAEYVNHAHNDYLELVFEGGVPAAVLIGLYLVLFGRRVFSKSSSGLQRAAQMSIVFILVHSVVDYPLRTMAISITFAMLNGIVFHPGLKRQGRSKNELLEVEHNGSKILVPAVEPTAG